MSDAAVSYTHCTTLANVISPLWDGTLPVVYI